MSRLTEYGFTWGPIEVTRLISDDRYGYVLEVTNGVETLEIHSTPKGKRVFDVRHRSVAKPALPLRGSSDLRGLPSQVEDAKGGAIEVS